MKRRFQKRADTTSPALAKRTLLAEPSNDRALYRFSTARATFAGLVVVLVAATAIRVGSIGYSLWYDELASLTFAHQPLSTLWSDWMIRETNPPLFYTLLKGWIALWGETDAVLRLLPIVIGLFGIIGAFLLGKTVDGAVTGVCAAALMALSAEHVSLSLELRAYILAYTAVLFACLGMARYLQRRASADLVLYGVSALIALYAHTTLAIFAMLSNGAMIWFLRGDRMALHRWLLANAFVLLSWAWWAWITYRQVTGQQANTAWISRPTLSEGWRMTKLVYLPLYWSGQFRVGDALGIILALLLAGKAASDQRPEFRMLIVIAVGAPICLFVVSQVIPVMLPRTLSWAGGPLIVCLAVAIRRIGTTRLATLIAIAFVGTSIVGLASWWPSRETERWNEAVAMVAANDSRTKILVQTDANALFVLHYLPSAINRLFLVEYPAREAGGFDRGLFRGRRISPDQAKDILRNDCQVAVIAHGLFDLNQTLAIPGATMVRVGAADKPPLSYVWRTGCKAH